MNFLLICSQYQEDVQISQLSDAARPFKPGKSQSRPLLLRPKRKDDRTTIGPTRVFQTIREPALKLGGYEVMRLVGCSSSSYVLRRQVHADVTVLLESPYKL